MHINRLLIKLTSTCLPTLLDETNPLIVNMFDNYLNKVNRLIKQSSLAVGLRRFEIFLFDREDYDSVSDDAYFAKIGPSAKQLKLDHLYNSELSDIAVLDGIEQVIRVTKTVN
jgi:hypothetical protein